jgi:heme-binding protein
VRGGRLARVARIVVLVLVIAFVAIQFVPYGWQHDNPPVVRDAPWPDEQSRRIARVSCYSCHSNETDWPPYSFVAPASWLVRRDVERGRDELNFSDWDEDRDEAEDAIEEIEEGSMPPRQYTLLHPDAKLTAAEARVLANALNAMESGEDDEDDDDDYDED